jgi:hypothetical protein
MSNDVGHALVRVPLAGTAYNLAAVDAASASVFALDQNRPNPFMHATTIRFSLAHASDVTLEVFDLQGERVATLMRGRTEPGPHEVSLDRAGPTSSRTRGGSLAPGLYFYRLTAGDLSASRKMLLVH